MFKRLLFISLLLLCVNTHGQNLDPLRTDDYFEQEQWVDSILSSMSIDQKIGQLFMVQTYSNLDSVHENKIKEMMKAGKPVINGWLQIPSTVSAEVMAHQGWDSLTIDMQHGLVDYTNALPMLQTISTTDVTPLARVNWNEPGQIMKILDAGCYGIICPMVSNKEETEKFVQACMYPPHGYRSFGPVRGLIYGGADYLSLIHI